MPASISIFGLGLMGRPMARRLIARGFSVRGWNRSPLPAHLTQGIPLASSVQEAAGAEVCLLMLADSAAVRAVLEAVEPHLIAGQTVIDMGTSDPAHSRAHAARLSANGIGWVDAPVSGGPEGAASGTLAVMAGGTTEDFERVRPVLDAVGSNVVRVGGPGAGHVVKIINQVIVALTIEAVAESLVLAERQGIDPVLVQQALRGGFADSKVLQIHGTRMIRRAYVPGARVRTHLKDLELAVRLSQESGISLPHLNDARSRYARLVAEGRDDDDHSVLHSLLTS